MLHLMWHLVPLLSSRLLLWLRWYLAVVCRAGERDALLLGMIRPIGGEVVKATTSLAMHRDAIAKIFFMVEVFSS